MSLIRFLFAATAIVTVPANAQPPRPAAPMPPALPARPLPPDASYAPLPGVPAVDPFFGYSFAGDLSHAPEFYSEHAPELFAGYAPDGMQPHARYQQDPADSVYREARRALNRGEWRRASAMFAGIGTRFPNSKYRADALYWQAFSLYRIGGTTELRAGLAALEARRTGFPTADSQGEAFALATRIRGALAARGDASAAAALAREANRADIACDEEELSVRASALSALMRADPEAAQQQLERVLARRDDCSVPLRKSAVMMLGSRGDAAARSRLATVATSDPSIDVRVDAVGYLGRGATENIDALEQVLRGDDEERVKRAAVRALGRLESPRARQAIRALVERSDAPERLRLEALSTLDRGGSDHDWEIECDEGHCAMTPPTPPTPPAPPAPAARPGAAAAPAAAPRVSMTNRPTGLSAEDAAWLRGVYPRLESERLKVRAATVLARATDEASLTWLMNLVQREDESADVRAAVISRLGRSLSIEQLGRLYDSAANRTIRRQIVSTLGARREAAATDKLIEIVRTGTDPQLRRSAISALTRKNDPRTTQLLLEMIDR